MLRSMNRNLAHKFKEKLQMLADRTHEAIDQAKHNHAYNEGVCCLLADTIRDLDETAEVIKREGDEEMIHNAQLLQNLLQGPIRTPASPGKTLTMLNAANQQRDTQDSTEMKEVILACSLDETSTDVMLTDLQQICYSIEEIIDEIED